MATSSKPAALLAEDEAVRVVVEALEDALERMRAISDRMLARGNFRNGRLSPADQRFLDEMESAVVDLAGQLADKSVYHGDYGELLEAAVQKAAKEARTVGTLINLNPDTIRTALKPAQLKIKDLMEEGARSVTELTAKGMAGGWSPRELSRKIEQEVILRDDTGMPYAVPRWRAEMQARNELLKVYRETAGRDWTDETLLTMYGPDDVRTAGDVCSKYVGQTKTLAEWRALGADPTGYGFHPNCRHKWLKATAADIERMQEEAA